MSGPTLTLAALAAFVACIGFVAAGGYIDGREYVYQYTGRMYSGYPRIKPQYSGYNIKYELHIQPRGEYAVFKIEDLKMAPFNDEVGDFDEYDYQYSPIPDHAAALTKPFRVYRKNGMVTHLEVSEGEDQFNVNAKKGFAYFFNLNFDQVGVESSTGDNDILPVDHDAHFYKVYEEGLLGDCQTGYSIQHYPHRSSLHNNIVLNVTKSRNYHRCKKAPVQVYNNFYGDECGHAEHEKSHVLHGNAFFRYNIRGDRHHYVIEKAVSEGEVAYTPYPEEGQTVTSFINRTLELIEVRDVENEHDIEGETTRYDSLIYSFDHKKPFNEPVDLKKPHYMYHIYGRKIPISDIRRQFDELVEVYDDDTYQQKIKEKNYPAKFVELLRSVGTIGYDEIGDLYTAYAEIPKDGATEEQKRYRNLFMDVLVNLGTNPSIMFGKHMIENKLAKPQEIMYFIQHLYLHAKEVSETLLDTIQGLCSTPIVQRHKILKGACLLSLSTMVYDHCIAKYSSMVMTFEDDLQQDQYTCQYDTATKYFNYIKAYLDGSEDDESRSLSIKAIGNTGHKEVASVLEPYVHGEGHYSEFIRIKAIQSLYRVGFRYPDKVASLVIPVLMNQSEHYILRAASFATWLYTGATITGVESIARMVRDDPDDQVRSYFYSTLRYLANATFPCYRHLNEYAHYGLRILHEHREEFDTYDYSYSHAFIFGGFDPHYDFGGYTFFDYLVSDLGYIPEAMNLVFGDYLGGKATHSIAFGYVQEGLEKFFDKILGPEGSLGRRSFFDLFKKRSRNKRDVSAVEKELNEIKEKLNLPVREYGPIQGEFYFNFMGAYLAQFYFDDKTFENFFKDGRFTIPNYPAAFRQLPEFRYQRFALQLDKTMVIPTELGIPLLFDYKQAVYVYHHNKASGFKVEPGFFPEDRGGQFPDHVKADVDAHLVADKELFAYMGIVVPFSQVSFGAGINRRILISLPLKLGFDLVVKDWKLKFSWTPVPHEIVHYKYEPYTFVDSSSNTVPQVLEQGYRPVHRVHRHEFNNHLFHDALGFGFDIKGDYENEYNDWGSLFKYFFEKSFREKFYYYFTNPHFEPYHVDIALSHADHDATKQVEIEHTLSVHDLDYVSDYIKAAGFDYFEAPTDDKVPYFTAVLDSELKATGDKDRWIKAQVAYTRDLFTRYHRVNVYYDRSPFHSSETQDFKVCASKYLKYPQFDLKKIVSLDAVEEDFPAQTETKLYFGKDCTSDHKIKLQATVSRSEQQRELEREREVPYTPEKYNPYAYYYQLCQKERAAGRNFAEGCIQYFHLYLTYHHYDYHIKYENLSPAFINCTSHLASFFRHCHYYHSEHNDVDVHNPEGEIHLEASFSPLAPVGDIRVTKPRSVTQYHNVYLPWYHGFYAFPYMEQVVAVKTMHDHYCGIEGDHVYTFDRYEYTLPEIDCWKVVAKDCSPNEYFTILASKITHPKYAKAMKIFVGKHKVELMPISDDSDIIVRVDGKRVAVSVEEPYLEKDPDSIFPLFYVGYRDYHYTLHSKKYGLIVFYNGISFHIQVSPFYRHKMCGICGNYNGLKYDGYDDENGCVYEDDTSFAYRYAIPDETCHLPTIKPHCPSHGGFGCSKLRTKVIQLNTGKVPQTCFSTEPVIECESHCTAQGTVRRELGFHCLPSKDDSTKALVKEQEERILYELKRKSRDHETVIEVPESCST